MLVYTRKSAKSIADTSYTIPALLPSPYECAETFLHTSIFCGNFVTKRKSNYSQFRES